MTTPLPSLARRTIDALAVLAGRKAASVPLPTRQGYGWATLPRVVFWGSDAEYHGPDEDPLGDPWLNVVVAAAMGWIARNFPVPDPKVVRVGGSRDGEEIEGHPLVALLDRPNALDDFYTFHQRFVRTDLYPGDSFLLKRKTRGGKLIDLYWLDDPESVEVVPDPAGKVPVIGYEARIDGKVVSYLPDEIIHIRRGSDPTDPRRGWSELKAAGWSLDTITRAERYTSRLMKNGGAVSGIITPANDDATIEREDAQFLRGQFVADQSGENAGKPWVATGAVKFLPVGSSPKDMALDTLPDRSYSNVAAAIGLSLMVLGFEEKQRTFANYEQAIKAAYRDCLIPMQARYAEALNRGLPELIGPRERLVWDYSDVEALQESRSDQIERLVKATGGKAILTVDEARADLGLEPSAELNEPPPAPLVDAQQQQSPDQRPDPAEPKASRPGEAKRAASERMAAEIAATAYLRDVLGDRVAAWDDGSMPMAERLTALHDLRLDLRATLRADAEALVAELATKSGQPAGLETKGLADAVGRWFDRAKATLRRGIVAGALLLLGPEPLPAPAREAVAEAQAFHEGYLGAFRDEVLSGAQPPGGTLAARAEQYGSAPWGAGQEARRRTMAAAGFTEERAEHLGPDEPCGPCRERVAQGWKPIGTLRPIGDSECRNACHCRLRYRTADGTETD